jgi:hypothetical protein
MNHLKYLLIKERSGMGNRLLNLLGGILYAKITDRKLIVEWNDIAYSDTQLNIFPELFILKDVDQAAELPDTNSVLPQTWQGNLDKTVEELLIVHGVNQKEKEYLIVGPIFWRKYTVDVARIDYSETILLKWSYFSEIHKLRRHFNHKFDYLKNMDDREILRNLSRNHLCLQPHIQAVIDSFKNQKFATKNIGVHIRHTDRKNSFDQYPKIIDKFLIDEPDASIFLATDNRDVQTFFKQKYGAKIIFTEKWFPDHKNSSAQLHWHPDCPDKLANAIQALIDMYLLASCNYLVCDRTSTFAVVAELISDIPESNVIDTSRNSPKRQLKKLVNLIQRWL